MDECYFDPRIDWSILKEIREQWPGKLVIKGIMDTEDARQACDLGIDGLIVSNHGGRQIEGCPGTAAVLRPIAEAVRESHPQVSILVDGGIRSGTDVFRMLALGADAMLLDVRGFTRWQPQARLALSGGLRSLRLS